MLQFTYKKTICYRIRSNTPNAESEALDGGSAAD